MTSMQMFPLRANGQFALQKFRTMHGRFGVIRYRFGRDPLSTNVRFVSIPTVNSGLWDLSRMGWTGRAPAPNRSEDDRGA
jgi:hypothetical protein